MRRLGPNPFGEELAPGTVTDCYLGLLVDQPLAATLPTPAACSWSGRPRCCIPGCASPTGAVYDLLTGHPGRGSRELVFVVNLAVELRQWQDTDWARLGVDVEGMAEALVLLARRGHLRARWHHDLTAEDAKALGRPVMDYAREELRARLTAWLDEQYLRWLHPTSGRRPGEPFL